MKCKICDQEYNAEICPHCRFNPQDGSFQSYEALPSLIRKYKKNKDWKSEVLLKLKVNKILNEKSQEVIAKEIFSEKRVTFNPDINLAKDLLNNSDKYNQCQTKTEAKRLKSSKKANRSDKESLLQKYIIENWNNLEFLNNWSLEYSLKNTNEVGEIDLIAKSNNSPEYVVIELKKGNSSDRVVGQLFRYMGWVNRNLAKSEKVSGMIIANSFELDLLYALSIVDDSNLNIYLCQYNKTNKGYFFESINNFADHIPIVNIEKNIDKINDIDDLDELTRRIEDRKKNISSQ